MFFPAVLFIALFVITRSEAYQVLSSPSNTTCTVKYGRRLLVEGEKVTIQGKFYIVEDCHLQRTYQTCGTHLWFMINIVCEAIEAQKAKSKNTRNVRRFVEQKLLTEACCENACTVNEMTRYCPGEIE